MKTSSYIFATMIGLTSYSLRRGVGHPLFFIFPPPPELKSKVRGRLRDAGEDLYDIRRGWAAFGRFVGAGRRVREVSGWPGPG